MTTAATTTTTTSASTSFLLQGARWYFLLGLIQKVLTFFLNQYLIASVGPSIFGQVAIQLELLLASLLFLSREGIRMSVIRETITTDSDRRFLVDISWIPSCAIAIAIMALISSKSFFFSSYDLSTMLLYCFGAFFESLSEPFYNTFQNSLELNAKIRAESLGVLIKLFVTAVTVSALRWGVSSFGYAQISYGVTYFITMVCFIPHSKIKFENGKKVNPTH